MKEKYSIHTMDIFIAIFILLFIKLKGQGIRIEAKNKQAKICLFQGLFPIQ